MKIVDNEITKQRLTAIALKAQAKKAKGEFFYFVKIMWKFVIRDEPVWNWHIKYLCDELEVIAQNIFNREEKLHDLLINIPPGTTKTTITTIMFPAWVWAIDPSLRIISNSYSGSLSTEHAMKSKDVITSPLYKKLFPEVKIRKDMSGKQAYANTLGGERNITSTGGSVTGRHAHIIINDDPQSPKQANSEAHRKQAIEHTKTLSTRKVNKAVSVTILIMQRLHEEDVTNYVLSKKDEKLKHINLPAEITQSTKPTPPEVLDFYSEGRFLDPIRLGQSVIDEAKVDLGMRAYNGQFLQNPTTEGGDIIKRDWFRFISEADFMRMKSRQPITTHFFIDTAFTDKTENDPTGIIAACKIGQDMYVTNRIKIRKEFPELIRFIPDYVKANGYTSDSTVRIEPKANGISVIQTLQRSTNLNVTRTQSPKDDKKTRLYAISPKIECGRVYLVEGNWNEEFIDEVTGFPNSAHDEDVDLLGYAVNYFLADEVQGDEIATNILW